VKTITTFILLILSTGCQNWPKDSYIQGAKSTVNTPWGPSTLEAEVIATGKAAQEMSISQLEERAAAARRQKAQIK
jgi:hypothetical protein